MNVRIGLRVASANHALDVRPRHGFAAVAPTTLQPPRGQR
jgi:hypothetical protein